MWERPAAHPGRSPKLCPHLEPAVQLIEVHNDGSEASEITGHSVGAITPLCLGSLLPVFFDIGLKRFEEVVTAGGSTHAAIRIPLTRFAQLTGATWVDVCKEM